jgi:hypothetical protein
LLFPGKIEWGCCINSKLKRVEILCQEKSGEFIKRFDFVLKNNIILYFKIIHGRRGKMDAGD